MSASFAQTHHPSFDLPKWQSILNEHEQDKMKEVRFSSITGPLSVAAIEKHRTKLSDLLATERTTKTDIFVWSVGEPPKPYLTKIGGMPYLARSESWPVTKKGKPKKFLAQICFIDSTDLVSRLPGDVLLLFGTESRIEPNRIELRWAKVDDSLALWTKEELAKEARNDEIPELFGNIHRTKDFGRLAAEPPSNVIAVDKRYDDTELFVYRSFKIGGYPSFIQQPLEREDERLICQLSTVSPKRGFSFVNLEKLDSAEHVGPMSYGKGYRFRIGDGGICSIFQSVNNPNEFRIDVQSH